MMIDHVSLGTHRYDQAVRFYREALAPLGLTLLRDTGKEAAFGTPEQWCFFLYPVDEAEPIAAKGTHIALRAESRAQVAQVHAQALTLAGQDVFTPRTRPDINDTYFGAMFKDLDGHAIEVKTDSTS
ncbi:VOC family protein [Ideonella sp. BN130291]|uniref:VOC family protein n=1 Tax=Ideonella sp. BN130291 TaxID=3112940 RepID=UPI002E26FCC8|nr:VOC family protein [Ideonella sp. BN130291]